MKKIYKIKITGANDRPNIWYAGRKGEVFEAELKGSGSVIANRQVIAFYVNPCQFVHLIDCEIVSEKLVELYVKRDA